MTDEVVSVTEVARRLGVQPMTVARWVDQGKLAGFRIGGRIFVRRAEFEKIMKGEKQ